MSNHGGGMGRRRMPNEKAKDFSGSMKKLLNYMKRYKIRFFLMLVFAVASTVFSIWGPTILGDATTEIFKGLVEKVNGTGSIDFGKVSQILIFLGGLYLLSACLNFIQGFIMTGISNDVSYSLRKDISEKINRMPMKYFESRTTGEVLSRVTNDIDTAAAEPEPECDTADHVRCHTRRCLYHDAPDQCSDDRSGSTDPAGIHADHRSGDEAFPEIFPAAAGISRKCQWSGGGDLWRP